MSRKHREAFEDFAEEALESFETVEEITLFGSVARGEQGARSDVDVLLIVEDRSEAERIEELAFRKATEHGVSITPIIKTGKTDSGFMKKIDSEGERYVRS